LQEIAYLTSPGALNPLPARPPISITDPVLSGEHLGDLQRSENIERPRKVIPDDLPPSQFASKAESNPESQDENASKSQVEANSTRPNESESAVKTVEVEVKGDRQADSRPTLPSHARVAESSGRPPSSPIVRTASLPDTETNGHPPTDSDGKNVKSEDQSDEHAGTGAQMLTAIYRPESAAAWRAELKAANEKATKVIRIAVCPCPTR
jgi:striatin 1/3/4